MKTCRRFLALLAGLWALAAGAAAAHDTWLIPASFQARAGETVTLDLTSGMGFPALDGPIAPERVTRAAGSLAGEPLEIEDRQAAPKSLRASFMARTVGVATVGVELAPRSIELTPADVAHYFEEVDPPEEARRLWREAGAKARWVELYTKNAKTVVRVGAPGAEDRSWAEPLGLTCEIVPEADPTSLVAGGELAVRVLLEGRPLAGLALTLEGEGSAPRATRRTDGHGRARFAIPTPGRWLLKGVHLIPPANTAAPNAVWQSQFTTLTFELRQVRLDDTATP